MLNWILKTGPVRTTVLIRRSQRSGCFHIVVSAGKIEAAAPDNVS